MTSASMLMEKHCTLENFRISNVDATSCSDRSLQRSCSDMVREIDNPDVEVLENLEDYFQDLNDRLIISRMVSDSVIKGMVGAVEQEAKENIARKELEISWLRSALRCYNKSKDENKFLDSPEVHGPSPVFSHTSLDGSDIVGFLGISQEEVTDQLKMLRKELDGMRGPDSFCSINSDSELVGLHGILFEKVSERWTIVDDIVDRLETKLESVFGESRNMVVQSKGMVCELQQEWQFVAEVEALVMANCIRGYQHELEKKLWNCGNRPNGSISSMKKMEEFRVLQEELDALSKLLSMNDAGPLIAHGSPEVGDDLVINRRGDHFNRDSNGKHGELVITKQEDLDPAQLKHMPREELISYFKTEMNKMKRDHESKVQEMTEDVFSLKREYLREKGAPFTLRKDKEFDGLRRKIPEVMLKLEGILTVGNCIPDTNNDGAGFFGSMQERLEALLSENQNLRNMVSLKRKEVKLLQSQVADAAKQISSLSSAETNLLRTIRGLKFDKDDAESEASIRGDVYISYIRGLALTVLNGPMSSWQKTDIQQNRCSREREEALCFAKCMKQWEIDDSDIESIILQRVCEVIYVEGLKDAKENLSHLTDELVKEVIYRVTLESEAMEMEKLLQMGTLDNEKLSQEVTKLAALLVQKERLAQETTSAFSLKEEQLKRTSQELDDMRAQQQILIKQMVEELKASKESLAQVTEQTGMYKMKLHQLNKSVEDLTNGNKEKQNRLMLLGEKEKANLKQMEFLVLTINQLCDMMSELDQSVASEIRSNKSRLAALASEVSPLSPKAKMLRRSVSSYKHRLERKSEDLEKAEAEVDLLGDQVDSLLSLLEKIYIALDHYSPILQHYTGIMEILKLVKTELSGESLKSA